MRNFQIGFGFIAFLHVAGMLFSPYLQSLTLLILGFIAISHLFIFEKDKKARMKSYLERVDFWIFGLIFLEVALGIFQATDMDYMLERLRLRVPFLGLPLAFYLMPKLSFHFYKYWWTLVLILIQIVAIGVIVYYLGHIDEIQIQMEQGKPLPTPANHIRYALLHVIAFCSAVYWGWIKNRNTDKRISLLFFRFSAVFLFIFLHFLAVRSGLLSLYFVIFSFGLIYFLKKRAFFPLFIFLIGLILFPIISVQLIPTLRQKMGYVYYDLDMLQKGKFSDQLSDASRLISWKFGLELFNKNPIFGVGAGNIRIKMDELYQRDFPNFEKRLTPHNQFIMVLASSGIVGFSMFILGFLIPFFIGKNKNDFFLVAIYLSFFASFWVEATFENAMGVAIFLFFTLFHLSFITNNKNI